MKYQLTAFLFSCFAMLSSYGQPNSFVSIAKSGQISSPQAFSGPSVVLLDNTAASAYRLGLTVRPTKLVLETTKQGRPVEAFYFPGKTDKRALIIGGVHGSELSAIAVAKKLIAQLQEDASNYYSVLVLPVLFPDNAAVAMKNPSLIGSVDNIGRYSSEQTPDPNRQMPPLGLSFDASNPLDFAGRIIEKENQILLQVIQSFKPDRILNIHAIREPKNAGIFADPRTDANGQSLGFDTDSSLAVSMATFIANQGGCVFGNQLVAKPTAMYHSDHRAVPVGAFQKRNFEGSQLPNKRGFGVSLGSWATTAVADSNDSRKAIRLLTMEFPGCKRPEDYKDEQQKSWCKQEISRYTASIINIFLQNIYEE